MMILNYIFLLVGLILFFSLQHPPSHLCRGLTVESFVQDLGGLQRAEAGSGRRIRARRGRPGGGASNWALEYHALILFGDLLLKGNHYQVYTLLLN